MEGLRPVFLTEAEAHAKGWPIVDTEASVLEALVEFEHPGVRDPKQVEELAAAKAPEIANKFKYVVLPGSTTIVRLVDKDLFRQIRASRNRNLISDKEQAKLQKTVLAIAGMSVGSNVALATFIEGISVDKIKLADADELSLPNLNRIRASITDIGRSKIDIIAQQLYGLDPYAEIELFRDGVTRENVGHFVNGADVVIDEVDDLEIKIRLRLEAQRLGLPVVMVTDIDHRALLDVERYDLDKSYPLFHGRAGDVTLETIKDGVTNEMRVKLSSQIVGHENLSARMGASLQEIGKTLPTWPQLGPAAFMAGTVAAYAVKEIVTGKSLSGRWLVALDEVIK